MAVDEPESAAPSGAGVQRRVLDYWESHGVPTRGLDGPPDGPVFRFSEGPPGANGVPHMGHLVSRVIKDVQLRYRRMRGHRIVSSKGGWDCHGLPVEIAIERRHGFQSRKEIEAYGVERFCEECRAATLEYAAVWQEMSRRVGYWLDYDHPYRTMDPTYIESVWWSLKALYDRGLLEKGHYVLPYCPRCETSLSSHEVAQGYREATDPSVTIRFPITGPGIGRRSLLVWTTTPWTLPANLLVAARADLEYSVVRTAEGEELVLASDAVPRYFPDGVAEVERMRGTAFEGLSYEPPFATPGPGSGRYRVVLDGFVTSTEGTGFVHIAPSFGPDDDRIGTREKVGVFDPLDDRGVFGDHLTLVRGKSFKGADPILIRDLEDRGRLFRSETIRHTYPFCWRCDHALLYRAIDSWFVRTSRFTDGLVRNNAEVAWIPEYLRDGRFGNFLTEAKDWALSRSRYWGTPLPIWECPDGHVTCVGGFAELAERVEGGLASPFDPHRVPVDRLKVRCRSCGAPARREPYTIDVWYESGAAPFAQFHYPFEPGPFDPQRPLDYVAEGLDQTRGWFYTMHVLATALFERPAFTACLVNGMLLDESGRKMSKSKGNAVEPLDLLDRVGGDAARWAFLAIDFTEPMRVSEAIVAKSAARTIGTLRNVVAFHLGNARADRLPPPSGRPSAAGLLDRWILSRLEGTRAAVDEALGRFDPRPAATAVRELVDDLSTWYVRRSRPRFWSDDDPADRRAAHDTLAYVLLGIARVIAPLVPFTAEWIHQEVGDHGYTSAETSVHASGWPGSLGLRDPALEDGMRELRALAEVGRELRQRAGVKSRIPLAEMVLFGDASPAVAAMGPDGDRLLADELNVKRLVRVPASERSHYPDPGWVVREDDSVPRAALPRRPTEALLEEGLAREVARRLQQRRKELGLRLTDQVRVAIGAEGALYRALDARRSALAKELLAEPFELLEHALPDGEDVVAWELDGVTFSARVSRRAT